jgi:hypothetical protein
MNPSSGVSSRVPNFVSGPRRRGCRPAELELLAVRRFLVVGLGHAGDGADLPRREVLHEEPVVVGLVDPRGDADERLDLAVGAAVEVEHVGVAHDRADAGVVARGPRCTRPWRRTVPTEVVDRSSS